MAATYPPQLHYEQHQQQQQQQRRYAIDPMSSPELSPHRYQHDTTQPRTHASPSRPSQGSEAGSVRKEGAPPSFVNNFWGANEAGYKVIHRRIKDAICTLNELVEYFEERLHVEMEYSKKLDKLNNKIEIGTKETGALKALFEQFQAENMNMVKMNQNKFVESIKVHNYEKLLEFSKLYQRATSKIFNHMNKIALQKKACTKSVKSAQHKYSTECSQIRSSQLMIQTTWGRELEKNQKNLAKLTSVVKQSEKNYQIELNRYKEVNDIWIRDWSVALKDIYTLEVERLQVCKIVCFNFLNNIATLCVDNDQTLDVSRSVFAKTLPMQGIAQFTVENGTGNKIPREMEFIDYFNGYDHDDSTIGNLYAIAKFEDPDYSSVLTRTYSMYSHPSPNRGQQQSNAEEAVPQQRIQQQHHHQQYQPLPQSQAPVEYQPYRPKNAPTKLTDTPMPHLDHASGVPQAIPQAGINSRPRTAKSEAEFEQKLKEMGKSSHPVRFALDKESNIPHFPAPKTAPVNMGARSTDSHIFNGAQSRDGADVFSNLEDPLNDSGGSQPTNYTFNSRHDGGSEALNTNVGHDTVTHKFTGSSGPKLNYSTQSGKSNGERTWSSPRRRASYISLVQDDLDSKYAKQLKNANIDLTTSNAASAFAQAKAKQNASTALESPNKSPQRVPIMKDFSIDFIAKALEDLNTGGNGDINRFRRSVRRANEEKLERDERMRSPESRPRPKSMPPPSQEFRDRQTLENLTSINSKLPPVDFINDSDEVATRYGSLTFQSPAKFETQGEDPITITGANPQGSPVRKYRTLAPPSLRQKSQASPNPYTDLHAFVEKKTPEKKITPHTGQEYVTKAKARYTYKPQQSQEIYFKKGWHMYVIHKQEDDWYFCELGPNTGDREGLVGLVPGNYVLEDDNAF